MSEAETMAEDALAVLGDEAVVAGLEQLIEDSVPQTESMVLRAEGDLVEEEVEIESEVENVEEPEQEVDQEIESAVEEEVEQDIIEAIEAVRAEGEEPEPETEDVDVVVEEPEAVTLSEAADVEAELYSLDDVEEELQLEADVVLEVPVEAIEIINLPYGGATSFEGAIEYQQAIDEKWRVEDGWWLLKTVIDNILSSDEDPKAAIAVALDQYTAFLQSGESLMSEASDVELEVVEVVEPVAEEEPTVEGVEALGGEVEDLVELPSPSVVEPPEAQAMSQVSVEEGSGLGRRAVKSFGEALDRLGTMDVPVPKKQAAVRELSQIAETEIQRELVSDANVGELVEAAVGQAMSSVEAQLGKIRELLANQPVSGSQDQTPRRPERKSYKPNIQAAAVTTRAQTFSDVIDGLLG